MDEIKSKQIAKATPGSTSSPSGTPRVAASRDETWAPLAALRHEVDHLFDMFGRGLTSAWPAWRMRAPTRHVDSFWGGDGDFGAVVPRVDVIEAENEYRIVADMPGLAPENFELGLKDDVLTIRGERKDEKEEKSANYYLSERSFGSFQRSFQLPPGVDCNRIDAQFDKGVLTILLPKTPEATRMQRKIKVRQGA